MKGNSYGQYWYGSNTFPGFLFKKNGGAGCNKSTKMGAGGNTTCNQPSDIWNKYIPGAGVGATTIAIRRFKTIRATSCNRSQQCGHYLSDTKFRPVKMRYNDVYKSFQTGQNTQITGSIGPTGPKGPKGSTGPTGPTFSTLPMFSDVGNSQEEKPSLNN